jgi:hypothetical protein
VALLLLAAGACSDSNEPEEENEPEIQTMTLTVGTSSITIDKTTGAPSGQLVVPAGTSTLTAAYRRADGTNETLVTTEENQLRMTPTTPANLTFTSSGAFGGTLVTTGLASGQTTTASVALFHIEENHEDFGPYTITLRIQ